MSLTADKEPQKYNNYGKQIKEKNKRKELFVHKPKH